MQFLECTCSFFCPHQNHLELAMFEQDLHDPTHYRILQNYHDWRSLGPQINPKSNDTPKPSLELFDLRQTKQDSIAKDSYIWEQLTKDESSKGQ